MKRILADRRLWIAVTFAAINIIGWMKVAAIVERSQSQTPAPVAAEPPPALAVESVILPAEAQFVPTADSTPPPNIITQAPLVNGANSPFALKFNQPMVNDDTVGAPLDEPLVRFEPEMKGCCIWIDTNTLSFHPDEPFSRATEYTADVSSGIQSILGATYDSKAVWQFNMPRLLLENARQASFSSDGELSIELVFNDAVEPAVLAESIKISAGGNDAAWSFAAEANASATDPAESGDTIASAARPASTRHIIKTAPLTSPYVNVRLLDGLRGTSGPLGIESEIRRTLHVSSHIMVSSMYSYTSAPDDTVITIYMNQMIEPQSLAGRITVEPPVEFSRSANWHSIHLRGAFKPGTRYTIKLHRGITAENSAILLADAERSITINDIHPTLRFKTRGIYLAGGGNKLLPLEGINISRADVAIERIYDNNVVHFARDFRGWRVGHFGKRIAEQQFSFDDVQNEIQTRMIDLAELLGEKRGMFLVTATGKHPSYSVNAQPQLVLLSDLGISVKHAKNDLLVWVVSLSSGLPVAGADVEIYSKASQLIAQAQTGDDGTVHFTGLSSAEDDRPFVAVARFDGDLSLIAIDKHRLDVSSFDTGGRPYLRTAYEAYVHTERGIYRPGDTLRAAAIVRGATVSLPGEFPVEFKIIRPDNRPLDSVSASLSNWGTADIELSIPTYALTGSYRIEVRTPGTDAPAGTAAFQVQEFIPDRMKVSLDAEERRYTAGGEIAFTVTAEHLFGAPAAGRTVDARWEITPSTFKPDGWNGFIFTDSTKTFTPVTGKLDAAALGEDGRRTFTLALPDDLQPPSAARVLFTATVNEIGGRGVTASAAREIDAYPHYVGLRRLTTSHSVINQPAEFECVFVAPDGTVLDTGRYKATFSRIVWHTTLTLDDGRYRYESTQEVQPLDTTDGAIDGGRASVIFTPASPGQYQLHVQSLDGKSSAAVSFYCSGGGYVPWPMDKPERLELAADKSSYAIGDTARIMLKAPFAGTALITVETDRVLHSQVLTLEGNTAEFNIPIDESHQPNAYLCAAVVRAVDPEAGWAVHRAYGVIPITVDNEDRRLTLKLDSPDELRPGEPVRVTMNATNAVGEPVRAQLTVAAVDEGILQLTRFAPRDPWEMFYGKRLLQVGASDIYSQLMPEVGLKKAGSDSDEGGDEAPPGSYDPRLLNPVAARRVNSAAVWQTHIETDDTGQAEATLEVPPFNGQLRLTVVAASASEFAVAESAVLVRQPLMITSSFPRFLAPSDEFIVPVTITNATGEGGVVPVVLSDDGSLVFHNGNRQEIDVPDGAERTVYFHLTAPPAPVKVPVELTTVLGVERAREELEFAVRPPATLQTLTGTGSIEAVKIEANNTANAETADIDEGTIDVDNVDVDNIDEDNLAARNAARIEIPQNWMQGTDRYSLSFSSTPQLKLAGSLRYLVRYPYGCLEQTTSAAFPLLYLADVAKIADPETFEDTTPRELAQAGVDRVLSMQSSGGSFGVWTGYRTPYYWGSVYSTHFIIEASRAGYYVPQDAAAAAVDYLERMLHARGDQQSSAVQSYACYVLARAGKPNRSWTYRLFEDRDNLAPYSRAHVAAALALMNDLEAAEKILDTEPLPAAGGVRELGGVLHSPVRQAAVMLSAYIEVAPGNKNVPKLVKMLEVSLNANGYWSSTQENAFALMALSSYIRHFTDTEAQFDAEVKIQNQPPLAFTHDDRIAIQPDEIPGGAIDVSVSGTGMLYYHWNAEGIPADGETPEHDNLLSVRRRLLDRDGEPIEGRPLKQGEVVIVEISIESSIRHLPAQQRSRYERIQNVVINDLLPGCLEIENPKIATSDARTGDTGNLSPERVEMRDDRLLLFAHISGTRRHTYRYAVRAVTAGKFAMPPITAFCMYDSEISSAHGAGVIEVTKR